MPETCTKIIAAFGDWWGSTGWLAAIIALLVPMGAPQGGWAYLVWLPAFLIFLTWWLIDSVDQGAPIWVYLIALVVLVLEIGCKIDAWNQGGRLLAASTAPGPGAKFTSEGLIMICLAVYWYRLREP